jgi:hypothetical protein
VHPGYKRLGEPESEAAGKSARTKRGPA